MTENICQEMCNEAYTYKRIAAINRAAPCAGKIGLALDWPAFVISLLRFFSRKRGGG